MQWETTTSYIKRLAARHHMTTAQLLHTLDIPCHHAKTPALHGPYDTLEVYFNAPSRAAIAQFSGVSDELLSHALPHWQPRSQHHRPDARRRARLQPARTPSVTSCPHCTLARTGHHYPVRQYLPETALICPRHQIAILGPHTLNHSPFPIEHSDLSRTPEILTAHHDHLRLLRRYRGQGHLAVIRAAQLTEKWRRLAVAEETIWPARARRIGHGRRIKLWYTLAREVITYPETITLARILSSPLHSRFQPGRPHPLYDIIARRLHRPYLADPALYPQHFRRQLTALPGRFTTDQHRTWWPYRWTPTTHATNELTELGYQPPPGHAQRANPDHSPLRQPANLNTTHKTRTPSPGPHPLKNT